VDKQENCRIAVSLSVATWNASLPIAYRLYLPKDWTEDAKRRKKAEVPESVEFHTKPEIAPHQRGRRHHMLCPVGKKVQIPRHKLNMPSQYEPRPKDGPEMSKADPVNECRNREPVIGITGAADATPAKQKTAARIEDFRYERTNRPAVRNFCSAV
jgi:hypothetical protein